MYKRVIPLFCMFLFTFTALGQDGGEWTHYEIDGYLALGDAAELITDRNNVLWVGAENSLLRFDGESWVSYDFEEIGNEDVITSMAFDEDSRLHVVADGYFTFYDNIWSGQPRGTPSEQSPKVIDIAPNGDVWIGRFGGVIQYDGISWQVHTIEDTLRVFVESIAVDDNGNVWYGSSQKGIYMFDGESWTHYTEEHGLGGESDIIVKVGPDGTVWCSCAKFPGGTKLAKYGGSGKWDIIEGNPIPISGKILEIDSSGNVWIACADRFVCFDGFNWNEYYLPDKFAEIISFAVDTNGTIWIGTSRNDATCGIYRFDPNPVSVEETE